METALSQPSGKRIHSIDIVRGIIMVIMALDHVRDFFSAATINPLDLSQTTPQLFLTRWITHFCAPVFVFLAGTSAFLSLGKYGSKKKASGFLLSRGLWIIFLELIIINLSWTFDVHYTHMIVQVFWAIGWSMIFLAALIWLPLRLIAVLGFAMVLFHNAFDGLQTQSFGSADWLWMMLHNGGPIKISNNIDLFFAYPLIPWIGVMALGYCFGTVFKQEPDIRRKTLIRTGIICIVLFIALRFTNLYGDSNHWEKYDVWWKTVLSFVNCTKYPPSLLYLLMTLGPAILILGLMDRIKNRLTDFFTVFGKVPMFYYLLHVPLIHGLALLIAMAKGSNTSRFFQNLFFAEPDPSWGFNLPIVYLVWLVVILLLYAPCRWFMKLKARRKDWWLSYL